MSKLKEQLSNPYFYVALAMIIGIVILMWGLDREGEHGDVPMIAIGGVLFVVGLLALITKYFGSGKKRKS